jgi:saccharopepsin
MTSLTWCFISIGPTDLTANTVTGVNTVPTVSDSLFAQGAIQNEVVGTFFEPSSIGSNGELTFGGVDTSKTTSDVAFVPVTTTSPASTFWGIDQSIDYGGQSILDTTSGIVDTGTTLILLASGTYSKIFNHVNDPIITRAVS